MTTPPPDVALRSIEGRNACARALGDQSSLRSIEAEATAAGPNAVPPSLLGPLWRFLLDHLARRERNGGHVDQAEAELRDQLRAAYLAHVQASGHPMPIRPDIRSSCDQARTGHELIRTAQLAHQLGVTDRHARRMARAAGYAQPKRGHWTAEDAAALVEVASRRR